MKRFHGSRGEPGPERSIASLLLYSRGPTRGMQYTAIGGAILSVRWADGERAVVLGDPRLMQDAIRAAGELVEETRAELSRQPSAPP
jgi:hypothetical protein